jgi:hypothetical protein
MESRKELGMYLTLSKMNMPTLRETAKDYCVKGRWHMGKDELIAEVMSREFPHFDISKVDYTAGTATGDNRQLKFHEEEGPKRTTEDYIETLVSGTLVAFEVKKGTVISGMYKERIGDDRLLVVTKAGTECIVQPQKIIWVKTGSRWPKWVYNLFGRGDEE